MAVKGDRLPWIFATILCLCTLVALWVTAARVKGQKMAARMGDPGEAVEKLRFGSGDTPLLNLQLRRGQRLAVEHFRLHFPSQGDTLSVDGESGRRFVEFLHLKKGQQRGWQELRLTFLEVGKDELTIEAELRLGAPCFGDGWYHAIRPGLRVEFDRRRAMTVLAWDPVRPELKLKVETGDTVEEKTLVDTVPLQASGIALSLKKHEAAWGLLLESRD